MKYSDISQFTRQAHYSVHVEWEYLKDRIENNNRELNLDPDFQRGHVWTEDQQIAYVEFKMRGGEGSDVILTNHPGWRTDYKGEYVLVDGKQRLNAVLRFLNNEIKVFGEYYYRDFEGRLPFDYHFTWKVNNLKTRKEVLQWYLEINTGGTPHTDEEIEMVRELLKQENNNVIK